MFPPNKILVIQDSNELKLIGIGGKLPTTKIQKEPMYTYVYTKSETKFDMPINFSETELKKYLDNNIFQEIK